VLCDVETLLTESERAYVGALSEVVKTALIGDAPLLELLEQNSDAVLARDLSLMREVVERCVRVKARIVALDEREAGLRATLNLGHTIGHALEAASGYTGLTHGEAVSLGLVAALRFGQHKGHTPPDLTERVLALLRKLRLPHQLNAQDLIECTKLLGHDKKRSGDQVRFVFASGAGKVFSEAIQLAELSGFAPQLADS
jgi:3-dehydroquinate synthetase